MSTAVHLDDAELLMQSIQCAANVYPFAATVEPMFGIARKRTADKTQPMRLRLDMFTNAIVSFQYVVAHSINEFTGTPGYSWGLSSRGAHFLFCARNGALKGILNYAIVDHRLHFVVVDRAGDICISIHPEYTRKGIATTLLDSAAKMFPVVPETQVYSPAGFAFMAAYLRRKGIAFEAERETPEQLVERYLGAGRHELRTRLLAWFSDHPGPHSQTRIDQVLESLDPSGEMRLRLLRETLPT
jgi:GNAT superfamily N-acetyltransferase